MSIDALNWAKKTKTGKSSAKLVLTWLADMCGADLCAFPSIAALAEVTELDKKTVQASLQHLIAMGLIEDTGERRGRTRQIPVYRLIGIEESVADAERTQKREHYQNRDRSTKPANKPKNGNITGNGIVNGKEPENGAVKNGQTIPFLEGNDPENGIRNLPVILKPKEKPPIAPQFEQPPVNFEAMAGEVIDFLNYQINGRTPKRTDTMREILERLRDGHSVADLNLVAAYRVDELRSKPELGHMLNARMIYSATGFSGYLVGAREWDRQRANKTAMAEAVEQQRVAPDVPDIDFDEAFDRLLVHGGHPENQAEKIALAEIMKIGYGPHEQDQARKKWRVSFAKARARTTGEHTA
ncbi:helix-turn-helix domain-containing protein [Serratia fonticola]|uniref:helix-turn-helix domain-containing protein n=1 Tax=Serratia fonticola TaxID=47917 RepID=UPI003F61260D